MIWISYSIMDEILRTTLDKVVKLCDQRPDFGAELRRRLGIPTAPATIPLSSELEEYLTEVGEDVCTIRDVLQIQQDIDPEIKYDFVDDRRTRDRLIIDNLQMESKALSTRIPEDDRFPLFCVYAFYQVENLLNYFYQRKYPDVDSLEEMLRENTKSEKEGFRYSGRTGRPVDSVSDVESHYLINAFCNSKTPPLDTYFKFRLSGLRKVRNAFSHRFFEIDPGLVRVRESDKQLDNFIRFNTFITIRRDLRQLADLIAQDLLSAGTPHDVPGVISSMLASTCYVRYDGKTPEELPKRLWGDVKGYKTGDRLTLTISDGKIIAVKHPPFSPKVDH